MSSTTLPGPEALATPEETFAPPVTASMSAVPAADAAAQKALVIVNWSGSFDRVLPTLIMSSAAAASGYRCSVFITFWGLLPFVRDDRRIVGDTWPARASCSRPARRSASSSSPAR